MACTFARTKLAIRSSAVLLLACFASACRSKVPPLVSDLKFSDKNSGRQLIAGFYSVEGDGWRWTKHRFAVILAIPPGANTTGATLQVHLYIPDSQVKNLGALTLSADVNDTELPPETFPKGGSYTYTRTLSPGLLNQPVLPVVFTFDKALQPKSYEARELGAVVSEVSLTQGANPKG